MSNDGRTLSWFEIAKNLEINRGVCVCMCVCVQSLSHVQLFATLWKTACHAPLSMGFFWQEYWSGLPFLSPGDLPDPGIEPRSPALQADSSPSESPGKPHHYLFYKSFIHIHFKLPLTATLSLKVREWIWIFIGTYSLRWGFWSQTVHI